MSIFIAFRSISNLFLLPLGGSFYLTELLSCQAIACTLRSQVPPSIKGVLQAIIYGAGERWPLLPCSTLIYFLSVISPLFHPPIFLDCILDHLRTSLSCGTCVFFGKRQKGQSCRPISIPWIRRFPSPQNTYFHGGVRHGENNIIDGVLNLPCRLYISILYKIDWL